MLEETLFGAALDLPAAARPAFLADACGADARLRGRVERLLAADHDARGILDAGPDTPGPATPRSVGPALAGGQLFAGRFRLGRKLGEGGMGEVWVADQTDPVRRPVALKVIRPGLDTADLPARFDQERQALARMDHPNIARVFDAGVADARPFFVMELIAGVPLTAFCDDRNLPFRARLELFLPVCQAVQHAHQKGVIHRDLKPANVLVAEFDGKPVPKVIDFGVAKVAGAGLTGDTVHTGFGALVGTPEYMAPEQAAFDARDVDTRADVYALGVLLYELLTGTPPFRRADFAAAGVLEMLRAIREVDPPRPSARRAGVAADLDWIVMKCLAKDRDERYATANGLARDVQRFLADEEVEARPPTARYRVRQFVRRHTVGLATAAGFVLLVTAGGAVSTWQAVRARAAEGQARANERKALAERDDKEKARAAEAEEAAVARAVQAFLADDLLGQADLRNQDSAGRRDPNVTARELLDRAARRIGDRFGSQPRTEAAVRLTIGSAYRALGEYAKAQPHLDRALALRTALWGDDRPETLVAANALGELLAARGRLPEAEALLKRTLAGFDRAGLVDDDAALTAGLNLAKVLAAGGRDEEAETQYQRSLAGFQALHGDAHHNTLLAMSSLGRMYRTRKQPDKAAALLARVMELAPAVLGPDHPGTSAATIDVARLHLDARRPDDAERLAAPVLDQCRAAQGPDHPDTFAAAVFLAQVYNARKRYDLAEPLLIETLAGLRAKVGDDDDRTLTAANSLAATHKGRGRPADAVPLFRQVAAAWLDRYGAGHFRTLAALDNLAVTCEEAGRTEEAAAVYEDIVRGLEQRGFEHPDVGEMMADAIAVWDRTGRVALADGGRRKWLAVVKAQAGPESAAYADGLADLGRSLLGRGKWADAEAVLREGLAVRGKLHPNDWRTADARSLLGAALLGRGQAADAEPLLRAGYAGLKAAETAIPADDRGCLLRAVDRLIEVADVLGRADEAGTWRAERATYPAEFGPTPRLR